MNGDNKDLWIEINIIKQDIAEIKTIIKAIPEKINYYSMVNLETHRENCRANNVISDHEKRIENLESFQALHAEKKKFWNEKTAGMILAVMQAVTVAYLILKLGLK